VVALKNYLFTGQTFQKVEIRFCFFRSHSPGNIPRYHHSIILAHKRAPLGFELFHVSAPARAENVHRLFGGKRKVRITYNEKSHLFPPNF
jgi:hypothetical protein